MRDHKALVQKEFGLWDRGLADVCPGTRNTKAHNVIYTHFGAKTREGTVLSLTFPNLARFHIYKRIGEADRLLILNGAGQLYDSTNLVTPILSIPAMTDFSVVVMFNRAYISPHDGVTGLAGEKVYVYGGSGVARPAGGSPPSAFVLGVANSGTAGNIEKGKRLFAVAYETDTGYITRPGPIGPAYTVLDAPGNKKADVSNIPIGPAGTVARHILATKLIVDYAGDQTSPELFFVPAGKINDNTTTTLTVNFFDSDLSSSADYLFDNLDVIPAFLGMVNYNGRLCGWGENGKESVIRCSTSGQPESHSGIEGFVIINPGDGRGLKACIVHRGLLNCYKQERHYMTQDNGASPVTWKVVLIDAAIGTDTFGVAQILDSAGQTHDLFAIASREGLQLFSGIYAPQPLTYQVDGIWKRINNAYTKLIQVVVDPVQRRIYVTLPLDGSAVINCLLMGDYNNGLAPDTIRWATWSFFGFNVKSMAVDTKFTDQSPVFTVGAGANLYKLDPTVLNDYGNALPNPELEFGPKSGDDDGIVNHFAGIRSRIIGSGNLNVIAYGLDKTQSFTAKDIPLAALPGKEYERLFDIKSEKCSVSIKTQSVNEWFHLNKLSLYYIPLWVSRG